MNAVDGPTGRIEVSFDDAIASPVPGEREASEPVSDGTPISGRAASEEDMSVEPTPLGRAGTSGEMSVAAGTTGRAEDAPVCIISEFIAAVSGDAFLRLSGEKLPHQSSSRTLGQMPSTIYVLAEVGCIIGPERRHLPQRTLPLSALGALSRS